MPPLSTVRLKPLTVPLSRCNFRPNLSVRRAGDGPCRQRLWRQKPSSFSGPHQHITFPSRARKQADSLSTEDGEVSGKSGASVVRSPDRPRRRVSPRRHSQRFQAGSPSTNIRTVIFLIEMAPPGLIPPPLALGAERFCLTDAASRTASMSAASVLTALSWRSAPETARYPDRSGCFGQPPVSGLPSHPPRRCGGRYPYSWFFRPCRR